MEGQDLEDRGVSVDERSNHWMLFLDLCDEFILVTHSQQGTDDEVGSQEYESCVQEQKRNDEVQNVNEVIILRGGY